MLKEYDLSERIVEILLERSVVDQAAVDRARRAASKERLRLDLALAKLGLAPEADLVAAYASVCGHDLLTIADLPDALPPGIDLPLGYMERARLLPVGLDGETLCVAMADPLDASQVRAVALKTGQAVRPLAVKPSDLDLALRRMQKAKEHATAAEAHVTDLERLRSIASDAPVVRLVDRVFALAAERRASDIHFFPSEGGLRVRVRVDGRLQDLERPPAGIAAGVISRVKLMAKLDIAETRLPQDGRIQAVIRGRTLDLRVSAAPTIEGESVVVRILDGGGTRPDLRRLGLGDHVLEAVSGLLDRPSGVTIVTGPTGAGKTTTLYAALQRLNKPDLHVATIEDPVEYRLEGINQIQVRPDIGFDFPDALRHLLRHDPDVVMIGEIRDGETARIGLQSALTGHPVLATLHTNDAPSAVPRLLDMGAEAFLVSAVLNGVIAQRLVRTLCADCAEVVEPPEAVLRLAERAGIAQSGWRRAAGCPRCFGTGYFGRTVIAEVLTVDAEIKALIRQHPDTELIRATARERGMRPLQSDALEKAARGITSLDEVIQTTGRLAS